MGIPVLLNSEEDMMASTSFKHREPAVIHHHVESSPPSLPLRHPHRRLTQHYQSLRQHYGEQPAIHRQLPSTPPPELPLPQTPRPSQDQDQDQDRVQEPQSQPQPREQEPQRPQQQPLRSNASALFRFYQQQQQRRQQEEQEQQAQEVEERSAPQQQQQQLNSNLSFDEEHELPQQNQEATPVPPRARENLVTATTTPLLIPVTSSTSTILTPTTPITTIPDAAVQEKTKIELAEQEHICAFRRAAEYERQKMLRESMELRRRVQKASSSLSVSTTMTKITTFPHDRQQAIRSCYQQQSPHPRPLSLPLPQVEVVNPAMITAAATRPRSSLDDFTRDDRGMDSGVDINQESEEEEQDDKEEQSRPSQQHGEGSFGAGRHHHRSFHALGPHSRAHIRSAIPSWPTFSHSTATTATSPVNAISNTAIQSILPSMPLATPSETSNPSPMEVTQENHTPVESDPCFVVSPPTQATTPTASTTSTTSARAAATTAATPSSPSLTTSLPPTIIIQFTEPNTDFSAAMQNHESFRILARESQVPIREVCSLMPVMNAMCCLLEDDPDSELWVKLVQIPVVKQLWGGGGQGGAGAFLTGRMMAQGTMTNSGVEHDH